MTTVIVQYVADDGTHEQHRYVAPVVSCQAWSSGSCMIRLRDADGRKIGWAQYSRYVFVQAGATTEVQSS